MSLGLRRCRRRLDQSWYATPAMSANVRLMGTFRHCQNRPLSISKPANRVETSQYPMGWKPTQLSMDFGEDEPHSGMEL